MRSSNRILFPTLIFIVAISGMSQGLVIPLLTGYILQYSSGGLIFSVLGGMYALFAIGGVFFQLRSDVSTSE